MAEKCIVRHPFLPVFNKDSRILILGSLPSVKSREQNFYYGHPRNRFWKVLASVFQEKEPQTVQEKTDLVLRHQLALWDVIEECEIEGSADSTIRNVRANDLSEILDHSRVSVILCNGKAAEKYYRKYQLAETGIEPVVLPSTSPANAAWSAERLSTVWKEVIQGVLEQTEKPEAGTE